MRKCILLIIVFCAGDLLAQNPLVVTVDKPKSEIQPTMWGIFFEDINFGADGGIYAELVKNRSFEFYQPLMGWKEQKSDRFALSTNAGKILVIHQGEKSNPRFARVNVNVDNGYSLANEGFRGMGIRKDLTYNFSMQARPQEGNTKLRVQLIDPKGNVIGESLVTPAGKDWKKYSTTITAKETQLKATLNIAFEGKGVVDIDMVSLFPSDTWKNRPGGLRRDLVQLLYDMKPGFLRFPGGCIVEGRELATRYQWKKTIGSVEQREMIVNRWNTEFNHRPAPDYFQTFGLGFFEYFQLSEDIGAEPLPILSCGMACQFNTAEVVPMEELDPYVQDALDLIEFANGSVDSPWGKIRKDMGHPAPFNLKFIGVGNEQWGPQYIERYKVFAAAIKAKYPNIKIVSGAGPFPTGELFDYASAELKSLGAEIVDEHYYNNPEWFQKNVTRYDAYDRSGPKIFAGEYAAQSVAIASPNNQNNWLCALSEAAFMTGLERNADVVYMCSYAPLFAHAEGWQWTPDLIWFDNLRAYGTPNYYVQKLYANNKGTHVLPATIGDKPATGENGIFGSAVWDKNSKEVIVKLVNTSDKVVQQTVNLAGVKKLNPQASLTVLKSSDLAGVNALDTPTFIAPLESPVTLKGKGAVVELAPYSFSILKIKVM